MNVLVFNEQIDLAINESRLAPLVKNVLSLEKQRADEVSIYFVSTEEICRLHEEFFQDPTTTDCISFPMDSEEEEYRILGEVFVCPQTAIDYVTKHGQLNKEEVYREVALYVVHGLLHLLGYDDIAEEDEKLMRAAEKKHMDALTAKQLILY